MPALLAASAQRDTHELSAHDYRHKRPDEEASHSPFGRMKPRRAAPHGGS